MGWWRRFFGRESSLWVFLAALLLQVYFFRDTLWDYHPLGDDLALVTYSTPFAGASRPEDWFASGYSDYFTVYPEWTSPYTNFMRPVANLVYWLNYELFGDRWGFYLLFGYLVNALGVLVVFVITRLFLQSSYPAALIGAAVFFLTVTPAKFMTYPSFAFDPLAAVLVGLAFLAMVQEKPLASILLLTLALFAKETVVYAPLAMASCYLLLCLTHRDPDTPIAGCVKTSIAMAGFPLAVWVAARFLFCGGFADTYITRGLFTPDGTLRRLVVALSIWPLGHDLPPIVSSLKHVLFSTAKGELLPQDTPNTLFVAVNLCFAAFFAFAAIRFLIRRQYRRASPRVLSTAIWATFVAGTLLFFGLEKRFGYGFYLFWLPLLLAFVERGTWRPLRLVSMAYLVVQVMLGVGNFHAMLNEQAKAERSQSYARARDLVTILKTVSVLKHEDRTVYLVNDVVGDHAARLLRVFAGREEGLPIEVLTSRVPATPRFVKSGSIIEITLERPGGDELEFLGIDVSRVLEAIKTSDSGLTVTRNERMVYEFPDGRLETSIIGELPRIHFGSQVKVLVSDPKGIYVYYDAEAGKHRLELPWTH